MSPTHPTRAAAPAHVTTGVAKPLATTPLAERQIGRITIDNADGLVAALGFIWVKTDDGRLVKVDPRTNRIVRQRKLDTATEQSHYCQGIGTDGKSVWACATTDTATDVVKVDPTSLAPVQRLRVNKVFDQLRLPFAGGKLWVLGADGSSLIGVDPVTGAATSRRLPVRCLQLFGSDNVLVATCRVDNVILRIDPASGSVSARRSIASPGFAATSETDTWVDTSEGVQRLDPALRTTAVYPDLVVGLGGDLAMDGTGEIWARQQSGFLFHIDPNRNAVVEQVTASGSLSGGSLLITGDSIWTTASDDAVLLRLHR